MTVSGRSGEKELVAVKERRRPFMSSLSCCATITITSLPSLFRLVKLKLCSYLTRNSFFPPAPADHLSTFVAVGFYHSRLFH